MYFKNQNFLSAPPLPLYTCNNSTVIENHATVISSSPYNIQTEILTFFASPYHQLQTHANLDFSKFCSTTFLNYHIVQFPIVSF